MAWYLAARNAALVAALGFGTAACSAELAPPLEQRVAGLVEEQSYVVLYRQEAVPTSAPSDIRSAGGKLVASFPAIGVAVARSSSPGFASKLARNAAVDSVAPTKGRALDSLAADDGALATKPSVSVEPASNVREPLAALQWNMTQIRAAEARAITPGHKSVVVGVLDSGIDDSLPDLQGQVDPTRSVTCVGGITDTDPESWRNDGIGHGSHVAGIIAAKANGRGTLGVAPGVSLAAVKLSEDGLIYPEAFICGLYWAATHDFDLVNASLFTDPYYYYCDRNPVERTLKLAQQRAISFAARRNVTVIAAASNENQDLAHPTRDPSYPTDGEEPAERAVDNSCVMVPVELNGVVGVSALAPNRALAYYSNYGLGVIDVAAPGGDYHVPTQGNDSGQIVSPVPAYSYFFQEAYRWGGRVGVGCTDTRDVNDPEFDTASCAETYALLQGTSQAAPHVTGVAALAISRFGKLSPTLLLAKLVRGATPTACPPNPYQPYPPSEQDEGMPPALCEGTRQFNGFFGNGQLDALNTLR